MKKINKIKDKENGVSGTVSADFSAACPNYLKITFQTDSRTSPAEYTFSIRKTDKILLSINTTPKVTLRSSSLMGQVP